MSDPRRQRFFSALTEIGERARLGFEVIRSHRLRSGLLVLGVAIGIASLMAMVAIISGVGEKIAADLSSGDQVVVYVARFEVMLGGANEDLRSRPDVTPADVEAIERLAPAVGQAEYYIESATFALLHHQGRRTRPCGVIGTGSRFHDFFMLPVEQGRYLTETDVEHRRRVCVLGFGPAGDLFPNVDPVGKRVRIDELDYEVVGTFAERHSIAGALGENFAAIPYSTFLKDWKRRGDEGYVMMTVAPGAEIEETIDEARAVMRVRRRLKPGMPDDFAVFSADAIQELVDRVTGPVALVLVLISSIGLLVGGIGVMNLMLVSVSERTREIGIRKAVGARRRDILIEVLVEAGTLTGLGGILGLGIGALVAFGIAKATGFPVAIRAPMVVIAVVFSVSIGLFFGLYPANRAAGLDPVVALRKE